jgi:hypothetical protein
MSGNTVSMPPKRSSQSRATEDDFTELKEFQARTAQQQYASNSFWERVREIHRHLGKELWARRMLQRLARRHEKTPVEFCEKVFGRGCLDIYKAERVPRTRGQVLSLIEGMRRIPDMVTHPYFFPPLDPSILAALRPLAENPAGAKRKPILDAAKQLVDSGEFRGRSRFHRICLELQRQAKAGLLDVHSDDLILVYSTLSPPKQNYERQRIRSGVYRRSPRTN